MFLPWGFAMSVAEYFYRMAGSIRNTIRRMRWDQQLAPPRKIDRAIERELVLTPLRRIKCSPISSRASQNAAALLFDLGTVDIR
jgi:hypothetical protein